ncbi:hypothetical protein [Candidatus Nitronereus thalassa]|uniref:Uncharacterized protein n=1 Tax=Candidatus Nitronereus thalassa TaxID=3020898 RepID=A0ABU3K3B8_9BACT|nr:hypothetical protein [Candidatus Nitronereus thalassa]MDT7040879.1 hypothetical protein [Candidatus Nitronereus thalassa]
MRKIAYGPLALKPWEFEALTYAEFHQMIKGYLWRVEDEDLRLDERDSWRIAHLTAPHVKRKPNVKKLFEERRKRHDQKPDHSPRDAEAKLEAALSSAGSKRMSPADRARELDKIKAALARRRQTPSPSTAPKD